MFEFSTDTKQTRCNNLTWQIWNLLNVPNKSGDGYGIFLFGLTFEFFSTEHINWYFWLTETSKYRFKQFD